MTKQPQLFIKVGVVLWLGRLDLNQRDAGVKVLCLNRLGDAPI